jgi:EAL domain-containing protein (putative c-di-GMP-specific phosphodiesterase class I)
MNLTSLCDQSRAIIHDAERGLDRNEFFFVLLSKLRLAENRLVGFEYLIRWRHPNAGVLAPAHFISVVEDSILARQFTDLLVERAARMLARLKEKGYGDLSLAINLSAEELARADFPTRLAALFGAYGLTPARLEIDLTGTVKPDRLDWLVEAMHAVQALGVRVALDDFGVGFNSLTLLQQLPADIVKFDRSYLEGVPSDQAATALIETLVRIARQHGKRIVLAGVETPQQFAWALTLHDIDVQGFYIDKPHEEARIDELLHRYRRPAPQRA